MVSEISLGTAAIGLDYGIGPGGRACRPDEAGSARVIHRALDLGVNLIDTARGYGESEAIIGRTLGRDRSRILLCSKALVAEDVESPPEELRDRVFASIRESLRLLRTDYLDIVLLHFAPVQVIDGGIAIGILEDARRRGLVRWIGASVYGEEAALRAMATGRYDCLQIAHSMLDRRPERAVLPLACQARTGVVVRSALLKGVLSPRYRLLPDSLAPLREAAERLARLAGCDEGIAELAYRYVLGNEPPHTVLAGASSVEELQVAVDAAAKGPLPPEILDAIRRVSVEDENLLRPATWGVG